MRNKLKRAVYQKAYQALNQKPLSEKKKAYYSVNRTKILARLKKNHQKIRSEVISYYSKGSLKCACCGETENMFLCIDHIEGGGYKDRRFRCGTQLYRWLRKNSFPTGFQVLCHNCNLAKGFYGECPHVR
jgi:hypothetical protein